MPPSKPPKQKAKQTKHTSKSPSKTASNSSSKATEDCSSNVPLSDPPYLIPEFFLVTFKQLFTSSVTELIQRVKGHLYERDYAAAFGSQENLEAYVVRWSSARALAYRDMVVGGWWGQRITEKFKRQDVLEVVCIGGGAGAEVVGFAAARRDFKALGTQLGGIGELHDTGQPAAEAAGEQQLAAVTDAFNDKLAIRNATDELAEAPASGLRISCVDFADWSPIVAALTSSINTEISSTEESKPQRQHSLHLSPSAFSTTVQRADVLDSTCSIPSLEAADIITILFTAGELYMQSPTAATKFFLTLHTTIKKPGALLVVVDSAGGFENLDIRKDKRTHSAAETPQSKGEAAGGDGFRLGFILDRTLGSHDHWNKVVSDDARWWRVPEELGKKKGPGHFNYPLPLENMRCLLRVYERNLE